jgi:DNA-binding CsgD family transcriptional regulator
VALLERDRELVGADAVIEHGGILVVEGGAGIGKTAFLEAACRGAVERDHQVLRARGSELEGEFTFGVVRQLFERRLLTAESSEREELLDGPAGAAGSLVCGEIGGTSAVDTSFAVLHGLYWLAANLSTRKPLVLAVDDAHWADAASLRWLAYLGLRLEGLPVALLVALRPLEPAAGEAPLMALRAEATTVVRPQLLSREAVASIVRDRLGVQSSDRLCDALARTSGGNPLYLAELLRTVEHERDHLSEVDPAELVSQGGRGVAERVALRMRALDPGALRLALALAILGDGCELRDAAALADIDVESGMRLAEGLVRLEVLAGADPPQFLHPIVRDAVEASWGSDERQVAHLGAARLLQRDGARPGRIAAHLMRLQPAGEPWVVVRLREAARDAMGSGTPQVAAGLLRRAIAEPPAPAERVAVLRELARAEATAGRESACAWLEEALALTADRRKRAEIALEVAEAYAALFRWMDAVDLIERALAELGDEDPTLAASLEGELVVAGLHDARRASRVVQVLDRLGARNPPGAAAEALAVGRGMVAALAGRPATEVASPLEEALRAENLLVENWDTRAALLWVLVSAERFETVETALEPLLVEVHRSGSARGLVATYSTLGLLKLRLGALPEADTAARVALRVLQEGDFDPGLPFAATVLADIAVEAGDLDEAQAMLDLLPQADWPAGVATVLIPAVRGRMRLAQGRPAEALADFQTCAAMSSPEVWGMEFRDVGYLHARSGAALALLQLGQREAACALAGEEVRDARVFGAPRALGVACRAAGLACGGTRGLELLDESVAALQTSPALLELGKSLVERGAALRRAGQRRAARDPLAEALDLAARCGARPLAARARDELKASGARPRREWRRGAEALTPSELRIARLASEGRTNREIAHTLYVTIKTVEGHLARAYTKLGINGRPGLSRALEGEKTRVATP